MENIFEIGGDVRLILQKFILTNVIDDHRLVI